MGIGNTTPATALLAAYTGLPVDEITGTGAGLAKEGLERKKNAIRQGIERVFTGKKFFGSSEEKKESGENLSEYLTRVRIHHSKELLCCTSKLISEIAYDVGYRDYRYFSQIFKKHTGLTPRQFQSMANVRH